MKEDTIKEELAFQKGYIQGFKEGLLFKKENNPVITTGGMCTYCGEMVRGNYHICQVPKKQPFPTNPYGPVTC